MKATFVREMSGFNGVAKLYRLSPSIKGHSWADETPGEFDYVVVSAVIAPFSGPETYIFGADETGSILDWCELEGSLRGSLDHRAALEGAGYEVIE